MEEEAVFIKESKQCYLSARERLGTTRIFRNTEILKVSQHLKGIGYEAFQSSSILVSFLL